MRALSIKTRRFGHLFKVMSAIIYLGIPRSSDEWSALAKIASGQAGISKEELRGLFMCGLVERQLGRVCLSEHGRITLGAAQHAHRPGVSSADLSFAREHIHLTASTPAGAT